MSEQFSTSHSWFLSDDELSTLKDADGVDLIAPTAQALPPGENNPNSSTYLLRIGKIFLGRAELPVSNVDTASLSTGVTETLLGAGDMAIVETLETIHMPHSCVGIVFGTNTVTSNGLLLLNPGFITAGHRSHIRFFVINFGKDKFELRRDQKLARLLVLRHPADSHPGDRLPDYEHEHHSSIQENLYRNISHLISKGINQVVGKNLRKILAERLKAHDLKMRKSHVQLEQDRVSMLKEVQDAHAAALKEVQDAHVAALKDVHKRVTLGVALTIFYTTVLAGVFWLILKYVGG